MTKTIKSCRKTAFKEAGFSGTIERLIKQTQELYLSDEIPWVLGYSGGKDSTAILQLIWTALSHLPPKKHIKPLYVISTDTLVENPIVSTWVRRSLESMAKSAIVQKLPIQPHRLTPAVKDRYWVNLIGRGYPAPRPKFRWCTFRLKITPSNDFINNVVESNGEAILVLGIRKAESNSRSSTIDKYAEGSTRDLLSRNASLDRVWVYSPIQDWYDDDVWQYLMQVKNPWGYANEDLLNMYQGATADGECPLVVDTSTPSCGDSRFGCYVCTLVNEDKSLSAMIQNDSEKEWMLPLLELRSKWLDITDSNQGKKYEKLQIERGNRDYRKMNGSLMLFNDQLVHGPYKQDYRAELLGAVLRAEESVRRLGPDFVKDIELLSREDLEEIRRIWIVDKHEIEDLLPSIYENVKGTPYHGNERIDSQPFNSSDLNTLKEICEQVDTKQGSELFYLIRNLLHIEHGHRTLVRRSQLFNEINKMLNSYAFKNPEHALAFARDRQSSKERIDNQIVSGISENELPINQIQSL